jgi:hypothetical protein
MKTRENREVGMRTRSGTQGYLTESGGSARTSQKKLHHRCSKSMEQSIRDKDSQIIGYGQKGNQSSLQKFTHLEMLKSCRIRMLV